jgi:hypothetical protein
MLASQRFSISASQLSVGARPVLSHEGFACHARPIAGTARHPKKPLSDVLKC